MNIERRTFLKGSALVAAAGVLKPGAAMMPSEQAAYDKYNALKIPRPTGLLDGAPVLQAPAPTTMGVAFAVLSVLLAQLFHALFPFGSGVGVGVEVSGKMFCWPWFGAGLATVTVSGVNVTVAVGSSVRNGRLFPDLSVSPPFTSSGAW